ncbi:unnamed protein product, partial [Brenthis ino]
MNRCRRSGAAMLLWRRSVALREQNTVCWAGVEHHLPAAPLSIAISAIAHVPCSGARAATVTHAPRPPRPRTWSTTQPIYTPPALYTPRPMVTL